jgi:hypothetical protein
VSGRAGNGLHARRGLFKEVVVALGVISVLVALLAVLFSSPDEPPTTIQSWAKGDPADFLATAVRELDGTSEVAIYGPPYDRTAAAETPDAAPKKIGPISLQQLAGVRIPIDTAKDYVIDPLKAIQGGTRLRAALAAYEAASPAARKAWTDTLAAALPEARFPLGGGAALPPADYGPALPMMVSLLRLARSGGLDGDLLAGDDRFYQTDYTKPLLFLSGGSYFRDRVSAQHPHPLGAQWAMTSETGGYPGQTWLWPYTFWYRLEPFESSPNADALVFALMSLLGLVFVCVPFIPGLRALPRHLRLHRVIWRP